MSFLCGTNKIIVTNIPVPESMLNKKSNSVSYHKCRKLSKMGEIIIGYIPRRTNLSDMKIKILLFGRKNSLISINEKI